MSESLSEVTYSRLSEESKSYIERLAWDYRANESEVVRRIIEHADADVDDRDIFATEIRERESRDREAEA